MGTLDNHKSNEYVKLLLIGDAKSGKTGSLVSLVRAGYKLRILDCDNLLDILKYMVRKECPQFLTNVESRVLRDKRKASAMGAVLDGVPKAYVNAVKMIENWSYTDVDGTKVDLGSPADWGPDCILVIDSLSRLCDAAYDWMFALNPKNDGRAIYGDAQDHVENLLSMLTSESMTCNLVVIAHVTFQDLPDGTKKGYPQGVGQKLSPKIPQYFSSVVLYTNRNGKRTIQTTSNPLIDLANPAPFAMEKEYPIETGLAQFFAVLRDPPKQETTATLPKPKALTLKRA
jgi:hypothetical protein